MGARTGATDGTADGGGVMLDVLLQQAPGERTLFAAAAPAAPTSAAVDDGGNAAEAKRASPSPSDPSVASPRVLLPTYPNRTEVRNRACPPSRRPVR